MHSCDERWAEIGTKDECPEANESLKAEWCSAVAEGAGVVEEPSERPRIGGAATGSRVQTGRELADERVPAAVGSEGDTYVAWIVEYYEQILFVPPLADEHDPATQN